MDTDAAVAVWEALAGEVAPPDLHAGDWPGVAPLRDVGWWYPEPDRRYPQLRDRVAVYAGPFDEVTLDGERVVPQPGGFYGGWITGEIVGPVKGGPGTWGW